MLPVWERLADELKGEVSVGKVNLETETAVKYRFRHKVRAHACAHKRANGHRHRRLGGTRHCTPEAAA